MLMSPQEIETWVAALALYDNHEFEEALKTFDVISDTSKILFNCGMIHATLGQHAQAVSIGIEVDWNGGLRVFPGRMFSAVYQARSVSGRRLLSTGSVQFPHGGFRGGPRQLQ